MAIFLKSFVEITLEPNPVYGFKGNFLYNQVAIYNNFFSIYLSQAVHDPGQHSGFQKHKSLKQLSSWHTKTLS